MEFPTQFTAQQPDQSERSNLRRPSLPRPEHRSALTVMMWDQAFLQRHVPGESFEDWNRVLDEAQERGYNTIRIDPMPQVINLDEPDRELAFTNPGGRHLPFMPWGMRSPMAGPCGRWLLDFVKLAREKGFFFILSGWWTHDDSLPETAQFPESTLHGAELWARQLRILREEIPIEQMAYVDFANEMPYFFPGLLKGFAAADPQLGDDAWHTTPKFTEAQIQYLVAQLDPPLAALQSEFPEYRFTQSLHGDLRWLAVPLRHLDALDIHFYADADPRWVSRTGFRTMMPTLFVDDSGYAEFSRRCNQCWPILKSSFLSRQRSLMGRFADWSAELGAPLTCTEGWSSWFYYDHPDLDWTWLLEWSEAAVEIATELGFWGVTPHNYVQPQFANWGDVAWHQRINRRFLDAPVPRDLG